MSLRFATANLEVAWWLWKSHFTPARELWTWVPH